MLLDMMTTMNISLPEVQKQFIEEQVASQSYTTSSEYVRDLIRREQERLHLRNRVLEGAASPVTTVADSEYFDRLRARIDSWSD